MELLEEEFRRYIRACRALHAIWKTLGSVSGSSSNSNASPPSVINPIPTVLTPIAKAGSCAYAYKRAYWYLKLAQFKSLDGSWPEEEQTFISFLHTRRPLLEVDWGSLDKVGREEENVMKNCIMTGELDRFVESIDNEGEEGSSNEDIE